MLRWWVAVAFAALAGCGGGGGPELGCTDDVSGTDGTRLTYEADGDPAGVEAAADVLCRRIEGLGDVRPAVAVEGDRITVVVPKGAPENAVEVVGAPGRLVFYDWESVLLDERCKRDPGRNANARTPVIGRERADELARKCGRDAFLVRQERVEPSAPKPDAWWIVRGKPLLTGDDVVDPAQEVDPQTNEPIVTMGFSPDGAQRFSAATRAIAERGADNAIPGQSPIQGSHHFAIALDDELVSTPFIDYAEHPQGIDGTGGVQIAGGFSKDDAKLLARVLDLGPLPVELTLVSKQPQG